MGNDLMRPYHCPLCGKCEGLLHCLLCPMRVYDRSITYVTKPKEPQS